MLAVFIRMVATCRHVSQYMARVACWQVSVLACMAELRCVLSSAAKEQVEDSMV